MRHPKDLHRWLAELPNDRFTGQAFCEGTTVAFGSLLFDTGARPDEI